ncbi:hypothetical protein [Brucella sp. 2716]|uniref:hypothetical protein n=1 Tax=Brucella sp. 2716 TaxID=2975052 RepID=UPI00217EC2E1|nr:hypothetical protein [Brucella sp. 2716]UWF60333.1 hypothetical protein NYO66_15190 [Brucella sp. 2716]
MIDFTIVCVLRSGGDFSVDHVKTLHKAARNYSTADFVCLSDVEISGVKTITLETNWPGWLAKLELFRPGLFDGPVLYLDLDTVLCGRVDELVRNKPGFSMIADFYYPNVPASGVMSWLGDYSTIYEKFSSDLVRQYRNWHPNHGDLGWIIKHVTPDIIPAEERIISYKRDIACAGMPGFNKLRSKGNGRVPASASLICFHGSPRPWEVEGLF